MGPLYGKFFRAMSKACADKEAIDAQIFGDMLQAARDGIGEVSTAKLGDKTMLDTLIPALEAYTAAVDSGKGFGLALDNMTAAALAGRDSTTEMVAKVGRASRLGERSKGVPDPGAWSCYLILSTMAGSAKTLLAQYGKAEN
jgi:dihydroxyacetone kinase-like protein